MKAISRILLAATVAALVLIAVNGLLRVVGAEAGAAGWPRSYGQWWPPTSELEARRLIAAGAGSASGHSANGADQDISRFDVVLVWLDFLHRWLAAGLVVLLMTAVALGLRPAARRRRDVSGWLLACGFLALAGLLLGLRPDQQVLQLLVGLALLSALIQALLRAHREVPASGGTAALPRPLAKLGRFVLLLWCLTLVQVGMGSNLRGYLDWLVVNVPELTGRDILQALGPLKYLHMGAGMVLVALGYGLSVLLMRRRDGVTPAALYAARAQMVLLTVQVMIGFNFGASGLSEATKVAHLWLGCLTVAGWALLWGLLRAGDTLPAARPRALLKWSVGGLGVAAAMALLASVAIQRADLRRDTLPVYGVAPEFRFPRAGGGEFGNAEMKGKYTIVAFMFTSCPSICPTQSARLAELNEVYRGASEIQFLSLTVDPETDSLEVLADYAAGWHADDAWIFARGELAETKRVAGPDGFALRNDFPNHSPKLTLVDPDGRVRGYYDSMNPDAIVELRRDLTLLIGPATAAP